eukprot:709290-Pyramimonas_sp.AAC.1
MCNSLGVLLRAPLDFKRDVVGFIGLCTSDMSQTRGFCFPRYRYTIYKVTAHGRVWSAYSAMPVKSSLKFKMAPRSTHMVTLSTVDMHCESNRIERARLASAGVHPERKEAEEGGAAGEAGGGGGVPGTRGSSG